MNDDARPDPDAVLARVQADQARAARGELRVFLGFAPGVGKTFRMLGAARALAAAGTDVVVGLVETHGRAETAALLEGLEVLPRVSSTHRGRELSEFDLEAALARRPAAIALDELAHTNAPSARHKKRWQDVETLVGAGIDVLTTLNVQHLESLHDVVHQVTGVRVREAVPDGVLARADHVELVDVTPEELLARLEAGKVYLPEQAKRAQQSFFRRGNLLALRELALRRAAEHVDRDMLAYRARHDVTETWPAGERILVCVGPAPSSARLVRAAARMAAGLRCPFVAAYVSDGAVHPSLDAHLALAESLGGEVARLPGPDVARALLSHARRTNVTRLVIGKPTHSRLADRVRGSLLDDVVRGSGDVDVHVISGDGAEVDPRPVGVTPSAPRTPVAFYAWAALVVGVTTGVAAGARALAQVPDLEVLYLLAVLVVAVRHGRGPALLAATLGVASYDFFFVTPYYTFAVDDVRYLLTFAMMFAVGLVVSELTARLRRQEREAVAREERTATLYALSREVGQDDDVSAIAAHLAAHAARVFDAHAWVLGQREGGPPPVLATSAGAPPLDDKSVLVARHTLEHGESAGLGTDTVAGAPSLSVPLSAATSIEGVLVLQPRGGPLAHDQRAFLDSYRRQAGLALGRARLHVEARAAERRAEAESLRSSLLSTVSHDLRTPLAAITGAATALRDEATLDASTKSDLVGSICDEARRLERLVTNLLDMTRLESGSIALRREWVPVDELVGSALDRVDAAIEGRKVTVVVAPGLPLVSVDPVLFVQMLVNLLENAAKYTPAGSAIEIEAAERDGQLELAVLDHGPGVPKGRLEEIFEKFERGDHPGVVGAGLGLAICRGIAVAHGGRIEASHRPQGGARFRVTVPFGGPPPERDEAP